MEDKGREAVITFSSHYDAVKAKRALKGGKLVPVPRALSSSCGTALLCMEKEYLEHAGEIRKESVYVWEDGKWLGLHH